MVRSKRTRGGVEDTRFEAKAKDTKKSEAKAKDSPSEDRPSRCQEQECSRPRTQDSRASVLQKNKVFKIFFQAVSKKKGLQKFFLAFFCKKRLQNFFQAIYKISTIQQKLLSSSREQGNFRGLEVSRPRPRT